MKLHEHIRVVQLRLGSMSPGDRNAVEELMSVYELELAKLRSSDSHNRREYERWYEANRLLENRIRLAVNHFDRGHMIEDIFAIAKRLPVKPRKKFGWRRSVSW